MLLHNCVVAFLDCHFLVCYHPQKLLICHIDNYSSIFHHSWNIEERICEKSFHSFVIPRVFCTIKLNSTGFKIFTAQYFIRNYFLLPRQDFPLSYIQDLLKFHWCCYLVVDVARQILFLYSLSIRILLDENASYNIKQT